MSRGLSVHSSRCAPRCAPSLLLRPRRELLNQRAEQVSRRIERKRATGLGTNQPDFPVSQRVGARRLISIVRKPGAVTVDSGSSATPKPRRTKLRSNSKFSARNPSPGDAFSGEYLIDEVPGAPAGGKTDEHLVGRFGNRKRLSPGQRMARRLIRQLEYSPLHHGTRPRHVYIAFALEAGGSSARLVLFSVNLTVQFMRSNSLL
jgi:hypothetical protein